MTTTRAFLNVTNSLTGRRWVGPGLEAERQAEAMAQITRLPPAICQILVARAVAPEDAQGFLNPALRDLLPNPLVLKDMERAAARFLQALTGRQRIAIFADYDVDGGSSAALLILWLRAMGAKATLYLPGGFSLITIKVSTPPMPTFSCSGNAPGGTVVATKVLVPAS